MKKQRGGSILLLSTLFSAILFFLAVVLFKIVYNSYVTVNCMVEREKAFWLAEAGIERAKVVLKKNPNWYTDLPHLPEDDVDWLKKKAVGERTNFGGGGVKIVKEREKGRVYALGFNGKAVVVIKKDKKWEEL